MVYYCEKCKKIHENDELCPNIKLQLKKDPSLLGEAANFVNIAGQYHLITSQSLDVVSQRINKVAGLNLNFEGAHQFVRDIQVFQRLDVERFPKAAYFHTSEAAKSHLENATRNQLANLNKQIVGAGQEVDWLRAKQGELCSIIRKSSLLTGNAPGVDGITLNRLTGKGINSVTIKGASTKGGINTGTKGIIKALKNGSLPPDEIVNITEGGKEKLLNDLTRNIKNASSIGDTQTAELLTKAKDSLKIVEQGTVESTAATKERIMKKIEVGKANTNITMRDALNKTTQGAIIGAAIGLTISTITNYIKYRNGEATIEETFIIVGEDTLKSTLIGGALGSVTLFLPGGQLGFIANLAIGAYLSATLINILDEIFGKGAFVAILHASGYIVGTSKNLADCITKMETDGQLIAETVYNISEKKQIINENMIMINNLLEEF